MSTIYVGIGEWAASSVPQTKIRTLGLGSCIGIVAYCQSAHIGGLLHIALPDSQINPQRASAKPGVFADTGIPLFLKDLQQLGINTTQKLVIKLVGGATIMDEKQVFNIGKRNLLAVKKILWANQLGELVEEVGGQFSRSVELEIATGRTLINSPGRGTWEI